uniref:Protein kinase domain-containing protein n=1 Tax=Trichobilharzia regenti TaxID=157069 RepID=A0AA85JES2_TRIRE|nr:unnamed protein product [Trichobilharzia regenti]
MTENYPREIHILNGKYTQNPTTFGDEKKEHNKLARNVTIHWCAPERSYHELSREYSGVDIRNNEVQNANYLVAQGGQLRPAISEVEGLDRYAKQLMDEVPSHPIHKNSQMNGYSSKHEAVNHTTTESYQSLNGECSYKVDQKPVQKRSDDLTTFEKLCQNFAKDSTNKNETRAGKRLGFYRFVLDIGRGNFSKVKLALHSLVNNKAHFFLSIEHL